MENKLDDGSGTVLLPMNFLTIKAKLRETRTNTITTAQFSDVPRTKDPQTITMIENKKIMGYYGAGLFYSTPDRAKPLM